MRIYLISLREQSSSQRFNETEIKALSLSTEQHAVWLAGEAKLLILLLSGVTAWTGTHYFSIKNKVQ